MKILNCLVLLIFLVSLETHTAAPGGVKRISDWNSPNSVDVGEFFLKFEDFPRLYREAQGRYADYLKNKENASKEVKPPAEQLSPKGLALMSYIYSQIDKSPVQPLVADSIASIRHITQLVDDAPVGTAVTIIFQPADYTGATGHLRGMWRQYFSTVHKTTVRIEKLQDSILAIGMDSTNNDMQPDLLADEMSAALRDHGGQLGRSPTTLYFYRSQAKPGERQKSSFECGIFATKDARELNRDLVFEIDLKNAQETSRYENLISLTYSLPTKCLKSAQSRGELKETLAEFGEEVVTRKGKTLSEKIEQFQGSYAHHYAEKYNELVKSYVKNNSADAIKNMVRKYDAQEVTPSQLIQVYGPAPEEKAKTLASRVKELIDKHESFINKTVGKNPEEQ